VSISWCLNLILLSSTSGTSIDAENIEKHKIMPMDKAICVNIAAKSSGSVLGTS